jgi:CheY-like chemotaxis protein
MPKTLLLADDSVTIQKVVGISFANEDVVLLTVDNGDDAVVRAAEAQPDIVLADVVMPGKNGYEVCEAIKADPGLRHIPVLLLTGTFEAFDEDRARRVGAEGHITKPFEAQALVDQVNDLLARAKSPVAPVSEPPAVAAPAAPAQPTLDPTATPTDPQGAVSAGDAYDFFDDDLNSTGSGHAAETVVMAESAPPAAPAADPASTHPTQAPGYAAPPPVSPAQRARSHPDETVAILPGSTGDGWPTGDDLGDSLAGDDLGQLDDLDIGDAAADDDLVTGADDLADVDLGAPAAAAPRATPAPASPVPAPPRTAGNLDFEDVQASTASGAAFTDLGGPDLTRETLLDPEVARGYDVSSSDLHSTLTPPVRPKGAGERPTPPTQPVLDSSPEPAPTAPAMPAGPPLATPEPQVQPTAAPEPEAVVVEEVAPQSPGGPDLSPMLRQRLHESLEKIAWEAFGDLSEQVTRRILERVEAIAWEVIPQMAEALIREEIRHMKGDGED